MKMWTQRTAEYARSANRKTPGRRPAGRAILPVTVAAAGLVAAAFAVFPGAQAQLASRKVSGTVVAVATQQPVPNARILYEETEQSPQTTETDAKGYFEIPAGRLGVVTVKARGFGTARRRWPPRNGTQLRVELVPPAIVRGTVTDLATGGLLPAVVRVTVQHPDNFVSHGARAPRGTFEIRDLPPGPGLVTARSEGFAPSVGSITVEGGKVRDARIGLLLQAQAAGRVVDGSGQPVPGAYVTATYPGMAAGGMIESLVGGRPLTGADGVFALDGLVPNTPIAFEADLDGRRSSVHTINVGPGMMQSGIVLTLP